MINTSVIQKEFKKDEVKGEIRQARFSDNYKYIIDSDGNRVEYTDPRVVHVWPIDMSHNVSHLMVNIFESFGWKCRIDGSVTTEIFHYSKKLCSGRECLPCISITGSTVKDIQENRGDDEISLYYNLDQEGPCQNGAFPVLWDIFAQRLNLRNVVFVAFPILKNNYMGQGSRFAAQLAVAIIIGDILDEAEKTLKCLASDKESAMKIFREETDQAILSARKGVFPLISAIKLWAKRVSQIPLKARVEETPKVLIFGGINVIFLHNPVVDFLIDQGIIPKVFDLADLLCALEAEHVLRYGFKRGLMTPKEQFKKLSLLLSIFNQKTDVKEALRAMRCRLHLAGIDYLLKKLRNIMKKSGLVYDEPATLLTLADEGHQFSSFNSLTETPLAVGKFLYAAKNGLFDGAINLGSFNCQPAMNSQAIIGNLANQFDIPYISIDCEGPWISTNQRRLLETIAMQAKRMRERKNKES